MHRFDSCIRQQQNGGPISLKLTRNIAQVFKIWWDRAHKIRLQQLRMDKINGHNRIPGATQATLDWYSEVMSPHTRRDSKHLLQN